jgi:hypothetical protein
VVLYRYQSPSIIPSTVYSNWGVRHCVLGDKVQTFQIRGRLMKAVVRPEEGGKMSASNPFNRRGQNKLLYRHIQVFVIDC